MDDLALCHAYLNSLHAYLQGHYTRLSVLKNLLGGDDYDELHKDAATALDYIGAWMKKLWKREIIQLRSEQESGEKEFLLTMQSGAIGDHERAADRLDDLLDMDISDWCFEMMADITSYLAHHCYSRDHFIRGIVAYGEAFDMEQVADRWRQQLLSTQRGVGEANGFYGHLHEELEITPAFRRELHESALLLPGIFRSKAIDLMELNGHRLGDMTDEILGFDAKRTQAWAEAGFPVRAAAYWRAFAFAPGTAKAWLAGGFPEPGYAASWRDRGIDVEEAAAWQERNVEARQAGALRRDGVTPDGYVAQKQS